MKYIIATEDKNYWRWQMLVQINNFKNLGIDDDLIYIVGFKNKPSKEILSIQAGTNVRIVLIEDTRKKVVYAPSIRPHILKNFLVNIHMRVSVSCILILMFFLQKKLSSVRY